MAVINLPEKGANDKGTKKRIKTKRVADKLKVRARFH